MNSIKPYFSSITVGSLATEDASVDLMLDVTLAASSSSSLDPASV